MRYKAILKGAVTERPVQTLSMIQTDVEDWAEKTLDKYSSSNPLAVVEIYELREVRIGIRTREKKSEN